MTSSILSLTDLVLIAQINEDGNLEKERQALKKAVMSRLGGMHGEVYSHDLQPPLKKEGDTKDDWNDT